MSNHPQKSGSLCSGMSGSLYSGIGGSLYPGILSKPSISLTMPKNKLEFQSSTLFPFFFNLIPEGVNKQLICRKKRIDRDDYFGLLLEVAGGDTIGAVKVIKM